MNQDFFGGHFDEPPDLKHYSSFRELLWVKYEKRYERILRTQLMKNLRNPGNYGLQLLATTVYAVEEINLVRINLYRKSITEIYVDVIMDAELTHPYRSNGQNHSVSEIHCFYIRLLMDLKNYDHFEQDVIEIGIWTPFVSAPGRTLDEYLIPHTSRNDFDNIATEILSVYTPDALEYPIKNLGRMLAAKMGLDIRYLPLSDNGSIRGKFYFDGGTIIYEEADGTERRCYVKGKTIVIDKNACRMGKATPRKELVNDTILHECIHAYEHFLFYLGQRHCRRQITNIACSVPGIKEGAIVETGVFLLESQRMDLELSGEFKLSQRLPVDWVEWQACKTTPRISMPESAVKKEVQLFLQDQHRRWPHLAPEKYMENAVKYISKTFGVTLLSARQRLVEIGYDQAKGVMNYADGKYIQNYSFTPGSLGENQTFTVEFSHALDIFGKDPEFRDCINSGRYIFVENHFCLACKPYIYYRGGIPHLTVYARQHMDECCLVFTTYGENLGHHYSYGFLRHEKRNSGIDAEFSYIPADPEQLAETTKRISDILRNLPNSPSQTLCAHMKRKKYTIEKLCEYSEVSRPVICTLRKDDNHTPKKRIAAAICIGLKLHPLLQNDWLCKLGIKIGISQDDVVLSLVLQTMYWKPIYEVNDMLCKMGCLPLTKGVV